jgi:polyisoprenyl-phosphate glycosyltransferase
MVYMPLVSIIIPSYNEAPNLHAMYGRLDAVTRCLAKHDFEFLFVDDGSSDNTPAILRELCQTDSRMRVIRLSRNFGSHAACLAGLSEAHGDVIGFLAADLQDPPELIADMLSAIGRECDVVLAVRDGRRDSRMTVMMANIYHQIMRRYAIPSWPAKGADVFMITRDVRDVIVRWRCKNTSVFAQILWVGFRRTCIAYSKQQRLAGKSKWSVSKKVNLFADSIFSFSFTPVRLLWGMGAVCGLGAATCAGAGLFQNAGDDRPWLWIGAAVLFGSSLQLIAAATIGEYVWRIADAVRGAPPFIIQERCGSTDQVAAVAEHSNSDQQIERNKRDRTPINRLSGTNAT